MMTLKNAAGVVLRRAVAVLFASVTALVATATCLAADHAGGRGSSGGAREILLNGEIEAVYPLDEITGDGRGTGPGAVYANLTTNLGTNYINGGASGTGAAAITRLTASEVFLSAPGDVTRIKFAVVNTLATPVTARCRPRFYQTGGPSGPGAFIIGYTFAATTFPASSVTVLSSDVPAQAMPGNCWLGITFDAGGTGSPLATLAELNALGQRMYAPATVGDHNGQMFRTSAAGSFLSNNPSGSQTTEPGSGGWELRISTGACCYEVGPCQLLPGIDCLESGGVFRGEGTACSVCASALNFLHDPPQSGFYYALDQISRINLAAAGLQTRASEQVSAVPASNLNIAYIDEFELTGTRVIARVDTIVTSGVGEPLPPVGGFLLSIWPSQSAAASDFSLQDNTEYDQGYTVPLASLGGGEYDLVTLIGASNPLGGKGLAVQVNPAIALHAVGPPEHDGPDRGITPSGPEGLVLPPGQYFIAIMHRAPAAFTGGVLDSTAQDPRFPPNTGFQVNPGGGVFPGTIRPTGVPAAYRVMARYCTADFNGDGSVNTQDLVGFLSKFGSMDPSASPYDLNRDGAVNTLDLLVLLSRFAQPCE